MKCLFNRCNHAHLNHSITMEKFDKGVAYFKEGKFVEALTIFDQVHRCPDSRHGNYPLPGKDPVENGQVYTILTGF